MRNMNQVNLGNVMGRKSYRMCMVEFFWQINHRPPKTYAKFSLSLAMPDFFLFNEKLPGAASAGQSHSSVSSTLMKVK